MIYHFSIIYTDIFMFEKNGHYFIEEMLRLNNKY